MRIQVECYAGYRGEESPRRFTLGKRWIEAEKILDRWIGPDHRYFKVLGDDGAIYILRYESSNDRWELTLYNSGSSSKKD
jgi:hypothetical protein